MVKVSFIAKLIFLFFLGLALPSFGFGGETHFRMEFSKREVFLGEQVTCNFVVYSPDNVVEVEVAKFPEFRGYWKENLVLRQGPIPTTPGMPGELNEAIVGTYVLTPMLGSQEPLIEPMKVVIRNPSSRLIEGSTPPEFTYSDGTPPTIKPLPPLPASEDPKWFTGAVGRFSFYPGDNAATFQKGDPAQFRITLTGQGNFQDINSLPLILPGTMEELGKRSFQQGSTQVNAKSFEYTVQIHGIETFYLQPAPFIYFDPDTKQYVKIYTPQIGFQFVKTEAPTAAEEEAPARLSPLESSWSAYRPLSHSAPFLLLQVLVGFVIAGFTSLRFARLHAIARSLRPEVIRKQKLAAATQLLRAGHLEPFLKEADSLARECLGARIGGAPAGLPKSELIKHASGSLDPLYLDAARGIFSAYERLAFRPDHLPVEDAETLLKSLEKLVG